MRVPSLLAFVVIGLLPGDSRALPSSRVIESAPRFDARVDESTTLRLVRRGLTRTAPDGFSWHGQIEGDPLSSATFVVDGDAYVGVVRSLGRAWSLRRAADGTTSVEESPAADWSEGDDVVIPSEQDDMDATGTAQDAEAPADEPADDGSIVDVLVVYTAQARARMPDIEAQIALAIEDANAAFERSLVTTRLRLVHVQQVDYVESGWTIADLDRMRARADGFLDDVPELQDACSADIVSLWISSAVEAGGRGVLTRPGGPTRPARTQAYNVVVVGQAVADLAFAHEVGHNLGCMHDRANSSYAGAFPYSYGYIEPQCRFRTIMAYGYCPRIANFSNPDVASGRRATGVPLSDPEEAHNALSINGMTSFVANFRQSTAGCCAADGYEPDDSPDAGRDLRSEEEQAHDFCEDADDWTTFPVVAGRTYVVETLALEPSVDTVLRLYAEDGITQLAIHDDIATGDFASRLAWQATFTGVVRLRASQDTNLDAGPGRSYRLRLTGDLSPPEPSADGLPVPLTVSKDAAGDPLVRVEHVPSATSLVAYQGLLDDASSPTSRTCVTTWSGSGDSVKIDGLLAGAAGWVAIASSGPGGESSAGRDSMGRERRERAGWPGGLACP